MVERYLMPDPDDLSDTPHARDFVMASDYDALADCYANEHICAVNARKRADTLAADVADVAKINVDLMKRNRALEARNRGMSAALSLSMMQIGTGSKLYQQCAALLAGESQAETASVTSNARTACADDDHMFAGPANFIDAPCVKCGLLWSQFEETKGEQDG